MTEEFTIYGMVGGKYEGDPDEIASILVQYCVGRWLGKPLILPESSKNRIEQQGRALDYIRQNIEFFRQWAYRQADGDTGLLREIDGYIDNLYDWMKEGEEKGGLDKLEYHRLKAKKESLTEKLADHIPPRLIEGGQTSIEQLLDDIQNYEYTTDNSAKGSFSWQNGEIERLYLISERIKLVMRLIKKICSECVTTYVYLNLLQKIDFDISSYTGVLERSRDAHDWNIVDGEIEEYKRRFYRQHLPELKEFRREVRQANKTDQERLQEIISALKRHKESGDNSARNDSGYYSDNEFWEDLEKLKARFPPMRSVYELLYKYESQYAEKTFDVIIQLGRAVRNRASCQYPELLNELSSDESLKDLEKVKARLENGKSHTSAEKPAETEQKTEPVKEPEDEEMPAHYIPCVKIAGIIRKRSDTIARSLRTAKYPVVKKCNKNYCDPEHAAVLFPKWKEYWKRQQEDE